MQITEVKVFPVSEDKLKAFVSIVLDRCFMVNDIKVIRGKEGLFISMPSRKKKNGEFKDVAHPLNNETRQRIENDVLDEYERILRERGEEPEVGRRQLDVEPEPAPEQEPEPAPTPARPAAVTARDERGPAAERKRHEPPAGSAAGARPQAEPAAREEEEKKEHEEEREDRSLEEIQERHLRDSFWSVS